MGIIVPVLAIVAAKFQFHRNRYRRVLEPQQYELLVPVLRNQQITEMTDAALSIVKFVFEVVIVKSITSLVCVRDQFAFRLASQLDQYCFDEGHTTVFILSIGALAIFALVFPVGGYVLHVKFMYVLFYFCCIFPYALA